MHNYIEISHPTAWRAEPKSALWCQLNMSQFLQSLTKRVFTLKHLTLHSLRITKCENWNDNQPSHNFTAALQPSANSLASCALSALLCVIQIATSKSRKILGPTTSLGCAGFRSLKLLTRSARSAKQSASGTMNSHPLHPKTFST